MLEDAQQANLDAVRDQRRAEGFPVAVHRGQHHLSQSRFHRHPCQPLNQRFRQSRRRPQAEFLREAVILVDRTLRQSQRIQHALQQHQRQVLVHQRLITGGQHCVQRAECAILAAGLRKQPEVLQRRRDLIGEYLRNLDVFLFGEAVRLEAVDVQNSDHTLAGDQRHAQPTADLARAEAPRQPQRTLARIEDHHRLFVFDDFLDRWIIGDGDRPG